MIYLSGIVAVAAAAAALKKGTKSKSALFTLSHLKASIKLSFCTHCCRLRVNRKKKLILNLFHLSWWQGKGGWRLRLNCGNTPRAWALYHKNPKAYAYTRGWMRCCCAHLKVNRFYFLGFSWIHVNSIYIEYKFSSIVVFSV